MTPHIKEQEHKTCEKVEDRIMINRVEISPLIMQNSPTFGPIPSTHTMIHEYDDMITERQNKRPCLGWMCMHTIH